MSSAAKAELQGLSINAKMSFQSKHPLRNAISQAATNLDLNGQFYSQCSGKQWIPTQGNKNNGHEEVLLVKGEGREKTISDLLEGR